MSSIGWDIGDGNVKVARVAADGAVQAMMVPFSIEHDGDRLAEVLERLGRDIGAAGSRHAVTMTAELSQRFRSKAEGVAFVLDALERAFRARRFIRSILLAAFGHLRKRDPVPSKSPRRTGWPPP